MFWGPGGIRVSCGQHSPCVGDAQMQPLVTLPFPSSPGALEPGVGMGLDTLPWGLASGLDPALDGWTPRAGVRRLVPAGYGWPGC